MAAVRDGAVRYRAFTAASFRGGPSYYYTTIPTSKQCGVLNLANGRRKIEVLNTLLLMDDIKYDSFDF